MVIDNRRGSHCHSKITSKTRKNIKRHNPTVWQRSGFSNGMALRCSSFFNNVAVQQLWQQRSGAAALATAWQCSSIENGAAALEMAVAFSEMVVMAVAMLVVMLANYLQDGSEKKKQ